MIVSPLSAAMVTLVVAIALGFWLSVRWLIEEIRPHSKITAALHAAAGTATLGLLVWALNRPADARAHASNTGFGWGAAALLAATLAGGLLILGFYASRRRPAPLLIAVHACAGIVAAAILAAYWSTPASYGR